MKTEVSILHHDYPSRVRETVEGKVRALEKFNGRVTSLHAKLERLNEIHRVELVAKVAQGPTLVADARGDSLGAAIDSAAAKMATSFKRAHDKPRARRRRPTRRRTA